MKIKKFLIIFSLLLVLSAIGIIGGQSGRKVMANISGGEGVEETAGASSITLSHLDGGEVSWSVEGSAAAFKLTWSKSSDPTYPPRLGDKTQYYAGSASSGSITDFSGGGTYYVRVCEYISGGCGVYSNQIEITLGTPEEEEEQTAAVNSIALSHVSGSQVSWSIDGYSSNGFKLVWSKNPNPTYPTRSGDKFEYLSSPGHSSSSIDAFSGSGLYYVRVCEYISGVCGVYSNQIEVVLGTTIEIEEVEEETVEEEVVSQGGEASKAAWYFDKLFQRLKKLELKLGKAAPSLVITPQQKATLIDARLEAIDGFLLTVAIFGLDFEIDASEAAIDDGENGLSVVGLEIGDRLLIKGRVDEESGVIKASLIHDRSVRKDIIEIIRAEIDEILRMIDELRARLEEI